jgi:hypothetical protein
VENEALLGCLLELLIVTLMAPHMSIQGAKKRGILNQSTSNCYKRIEEIGKMFINRKISLEDFLRNLNAVTNRSDGTLVRRTGKKVYAAKKLKNYAKGNYGVYQDMSRNAKRYNGVNFITALKLINHKKRHLSKPEELVKAMKKGIVKAGEWLVIDAGLKSVNVLRQARISGVKLVTRFNSNFVVKRFGKEYRKEDILSDIKPIKRVINGKSSTIYQLKRCIWQGTMGQPVFGQR